MENKTDNTMTKRTRALKW